MKKLTRFISTWIFVVSSVSLVLMCRANAFSAPERDDQIVYTVKPSDADPNIRDFDAPAQVLFNKGVGSTAQLVLFLAGTRGRPRDRLMLRMVADRGYRVIDLHYNDDIAVNSKCPRNADDECSNHFRTDRVYGDDQSRFTQTPAAETVVNRLVKTLEYLDRNHPGEHWGDYIANGQPNWPRIVVSGLSQGAGMAALIAKHDEVARVVLFSSPADFVDDESKPTGSHPAPWLSRPSATPMDRWYAEYHARERGAARLKEAYQALRIPPDHVFVFNLDMREGYQGSSDNPFHASTIKNPGYAEQWKAMFGASPN